MIIGREEPNSLPDKMEPPQSPHRAWISIKMDVNLHATSLKKKKPSVIMCSF